MSTFRVNTPFPRNQRPERYTANSDVAKASEMAQAATAHQANREALRSKFSPVLVEVPTEVFCEILPAEWALEGSGRFARLRQVVCLDSVDAVPLPFNAWEVREEFLRLKRGDLPQLMEFLSHGQWSESPPNDLEEYWRMQDDLRDVLGKPGYYRREFLEKGIQLFREPVPASFPWTLNYKRSRKRRSWLGVLMPRLQLKASTILAALQISTQIDVARKTKFGECRECHTLFALITRHERKYCKKCGHLVASRKSMRRKRHKHARARAHSTQTE